MASGSIPKLLATCAVLCLGAGGLAVIQLNSAQDFTWAGALSDFPGWLNRAPNPWLLLSSTVAASTGVLGLWAAVAQLLAKRAYTEERGAEDRKHQNASFKVADERQTERHDETLGLLTENTEITRRDKHEQALADLHAGRAGPELLARYKQILAATEAIDGPVPESAVAEAAVTAQVLAESADPREQAIAELVDAGRFREAARQRADLAEGRLQEAGKPIAEQFREAGRLALPFNPAEALDYFSRATQVDPEDVWGWIELGQLRRQYDTLAAVRTCFHNALQRVSDQEDRMALHISFGDVLVAEGHLAEARNEFESALAIAKHLADADPHDVDWQRDLCICHNELGDIETEVGNLSGARKHYEDALAISQRLADGDPHDVDWQRNLSVSNEGLGDLEAEAGNPPVARTHYEAALAIRQRLAEGDPHNAEWQRDLSVSRNKFGDLETRAGNLPAARAHYEAALVIAQRLTDGDPRNAEWQRDLSISHDNFGDRETEAGNLPVARTHYEAALAIRQRLADSDPHNALWQRDLSVCHNKLGDLETRAGNLPAARKHHENALASAQHLAHSDPHNIQWQRDLSICYERLGNLAEIMGHLTEGVARHRAALAIAQELAERWPDHPQFARDLAITKRRLAELEGQDGAA